jgi:hypothetical protein
LAQPDASATWWECARAKKAGLPVRRQTDGEDGSILQSMGLPDTDWLLEWDGMPYAVSRVDSNVRIRYVTDGFWSWALVRRDAELSRGHSPYEMLEDAAALLSGRHSLSAYG